jgi:quercetin dioxygenase-like cupin family protein
VPCGNLQGRSDDRQGHERPAPELRLQRHALGELYIGQLKLGVPLKAFISDPDTGTSVQMIKYEAGFTNPWHRHNCPHGIYVLEGTLKTHAGTFGPGNFIWFPEGMLMEHGATEDGDVTTLFITNKPFDIRYAFEDEQDSSTG